MRKLLYVTQNITLIFINAIQHLSAIFDNMNKHEYINRNIYIIRML